MTPGGSSAPSRQQSVDTFRLLAALCIIILHVEAPNVSGEIFAGLRLTSRWAIPFFFIASGYFFAAKHAAGGRLNVQPTVERLIWIFLLWALIYFPVVMDQHDLNTALGRIFSAGFILYGNFLHLWFIASLMYGYLFLAACYRYKLNGILPFIAISVIALALVSTPYSFLNQQRIKIEFDYIYWLSIPFLYLGFRFQKYGFPSWRVSLLLAVFGAVMQLFEARFLYDWFSISVFGHEFLISTIPFATGMAGLALGNLKYLQLPVFSNWGRDYSLGIYLLHPLVIHLFGNWVSPHMRGVKSSPIWQLAYPLVILILCLMVLSAIRRFLPKIFNILHGRHVPADE